MRGATHFQKLDKAGEGISLVSTQIDLRSIPNIPASSSQLPRYIRKRDGAVAQFDILKVVTACQKAAVAAQVPSPNMVALSVATEVEELCRKHPGDMLDIPSIQQYVEDVLMSLYPEVARLYIEYRHDRDTTRVRGSVLHAQLMGLVDKTDSEAVTENANKDANVFPVMRDLMAGIVSKQFASNFLSKEVIQAHDSGALHFHDLDYSPFLPFTNCCLVDLKGMLEHGFRLGNAGRRANTKSTRCSVRTGSSRS